MPPRYAYWTILIDHAPTAFRAKEQADLLPTLQQLRRTNQDVTLKWFAHGRLWDSPELAVRPRPPREDDGVKRGRDWRPGGAHKDPRARFDKTTKKKDRPDWKAKRPPGAGAHTDRRAFDKTRDDRRGPGSRPDRPGPDRQDRLDRPDRRERSDRHDRPRAGGQDPRFAGGSQKPWRPKPSWPRREPHGSGRPWQGQGHPPPSSRDRQGSDRRSLKPTTSDRVPSDRKPSTRRPPGQGPSDRGPFDRGHSGRGPSDRKPFDRPAPPGGERGGWRGKPADRRGGWKGTPKAHGSRPLRKDDTGHERRRKPKDPKAPGGSDSE